MYIVSGCLWKQTALWNSLQEATPETGEISKFPEENGWSTTDKKENSLKCSWNQAQGGLVMFLKVMYQMF